MQRKTDVRVIGMVGKIYSLGIIYITKDFFKS